MSNPVIDHMGAQYWFDDDGKWHREDGPAYIGTYEYRVWYSHGKRHRWDGPAVTWSDGDVEYWVNGSLVDDKNDIGLFTGNDNDILVLRLKYG